MDDLQEVLVAEEHRLQAKGGGSSNQVHGEEAFFTKGRFKGKNKSKQDHGGHSSSLDGRKKDKSKYKCFYCGIKGHFANDCYKTKKDLGEKQRNLTMEEDEEHSNESLVMTSCFLTNLGEIYPWWIDSGASSHMTRHKEYFTSLLSYEREGKIIYMANDGECDIKGIGSILISLSTNRNATLENVLFIPSITKNLLSVSQMVDKGLEVKFVGEACLISKNGSLIAKGKRHGNLFKIDGGVITRREGFVAREQISTQEVWHRRLGHPNFRSLEIMAKKELVLGLPKSFSSKNIVCEHCE